MKNIPSYNEFLNELNAWDPAAIKLLQDFCKQLSFGDKLSDIGGGFYQGKNPSIPDVKTISAELRKKFDLYIEPGQNYFALYKDNIFVFNQKKQEPIIMFKSLGPNQKKIGMNMP